MEQAKFLTIQKINERGFKLIEASVLKIYEDKGLIRHDPEN